MKWLKGLALAGVMALPAIAWAQVPGKKGASAEQQVADIETQWLDAVRTNNAGFLEKLLAPEFREVSSTGEIRTRTQLLARAQKPRRVVDELRG
ncbi:MAG: nuclear transport factor 2 family protein, partial [Terriglobia bacterium]